MCNSNSHRKLFSFQQNAIENVYEMIANLFWSKCDDKPCELTVSLTGNFSEMILETGTPMDGVGMIVFTFVSILYIYISVSWVVQRVCIEIICW